MKIALLIYCSSILCMAFSYPNNSKETQSKRDTSYSYVASDINSKEGTHIKTIAVIKNIDSKNGKAKNDNWADKIHENFEAFGKIPEVPDIDDLFEFTKNIKPIQKKENVDIITEVSKSEKPLPESEIKDVSEKPVTISIEKTTEEKSNEKMKEIKIETIPDDVELISTVDNLKQKSQSLPYVPHPQGSNKINVKIQLPQPQNKYLTEYSTPEHSVRQYFISAEPEKSAEYKKIPTYVKPNYNNNFPVYSPLPSSLPPSSSHVPSYPNGIGNGQSGGGVTTTQTSKPPYLAPNKVKKSQNDKKKTTNIPFALSSQAPYLAPSIKKAYDIQLNRNNNNVLNQNGKYNQTNNITGRNNETKNTIVPVNLRIGSNIPFSAVTRSRGIRFSKI